MSALPTGLQSRPPHMPEQDSSAKNEDKASLQEERKKARNRKANEKRKRKAQKKIAEHALKRSQDDGGCGREDPSNEMASHGPLIIDGNKSSSTEHGQGRDVQGSRSSVGSNPMTGHNKSAPEQAEVVRPSADTNEPDSPTSPVAFLGYSSGTPPPVSSAPPFQQQPGNRSPFISHGIIFGKGSESDESTSPTPYYNYYGHQPIQYYPPQPHPTTQYPAPNLVFHYPAGPNTYPNAYNNSQNPALFYHPGPPPQSFLHSDYSYHYSYPGHMCDCREPSCRGFESYPSYSTGPSIPNYDKRGGHRNWSLPDEDLRERRPFSEKDFSDSTDAAFDTPATPPVPESAEQRDIPRQEKSLEECVERIQLQNDDHDPVPENPGEMEPVSQHLLRMYKSGELADYKLILSSSSGRFHTVYFPLHAVVASRSPMLAMLMKGTSRDEHKRRPRPIDAVAAGDFLQSIAMDMAMQNLYGLPLVHGENFGITGSATTTQDTDHQEDVTRITSNTAAQIEFFLSYITAGSFLSNSKIVRRGAKLATRGIDWNSITTVLHFGLSPIDFMIAPAKQVLAADDASSSSTIQNESIADAEDDADGEDNASERALENKNFFLVKGTLNQELQDIWAPKLLREALAFIASNLSPDFRLDTNAETIFLPDISSETGSTKATARSRLFLSSHVSGVKFGDFGSASDSLANRDITLVSSIFVSLPFRILKELFNTMKIIGSFTTSLAVQVVVERETRRLRALRAMNMKSDGSGKSMHLRKSNPLGWKESVNRETGDLEEDGISLNRTWTGLEAPAFVAGGCG